MRYLSMLTGRSKKKQTHPVKPTLIRRNSKLKSVHLGGGDALLVASRMRAAQSRPPSSDLSVSGHTPQMTSLLLTS